MPVGLQATAPTDGDDDLEIAAAAAAVAVRPRHFLGVTAHGLAGIVQSSGNTDCAVVLGGGKGEPQARADRALAAGAELGATVVDCGVGGALPEQQLAMAAALAEKVAAGGGAAGAQEGRGLAGISLHSYVEM